MFSLVFFMALFFIVLIAALVGFARGFIKSIAGFIEYTLAVFISYTFASPLSIIVKKLPFIANMITDIEMPDLSNGTLVDKLVTMVKYISQSGLNSGSTENVKQIANNYLADLISIAIAFAALFIVTILVLKLVVYLLDKFAKTEGIKQLNRFLGLLFGLFLGLLITWILATVFRNFVYPILLVNYPDVISETMGDSFFMKLFTEFNPISVVMNYLIQIK